MQMKQPTHSQQWYDRLCRIYNIGDFPPLHSFSFTDWHWINDDDLETSPPFKMIPSASFSNDFWTMIMDDEDESPSRILYSDAVQRSSPANVIVHNSTKKWRHSNSANSNRKHENDHLYAETTTDDSGEDEDLWLQYKTTQRHTRHHQRRVGRRSLKPIISPRPFCLENAHNGEKKNLGQRKRHARKLTHQGKSPIRFVRRQNRHCAHYR